MERTTHLFVVSLVLGFLLLSISSAGAEMDVGDYTLSGSAEVDGLPRTFKGDKSRFELYRDVPETAVVPQLELMLGSKKQDFFFNFGATSVGLDNQSYLLRFGRYGLFNVEFEWDQIPHTFNVDNARTPYGMNGGSYTLPVRPTVGDISSNSTNPATSPFNAWLNANARHVDMSLLDKIGKLTVNYTPTAGLSFTGRYWLENSSGKMPISFPFGSNTNANIAELAEPIDYQTNNIELGGEYAGQGWALGLRYNGSFFHNSTSTLVFDNPAVAGSPCVSSAAINYNTATGPCQGRADLYPSNQAHTFTLTGTASLPLKTHFLGTASYGWRWQNDSFLPFTINSAIANPTLSRNSLDGDVRPAMVNLTVVNNFVERLNLKAYYRFYDLNNHTTPVTTTGTVRNDQSSGGPDWTTAQFFQYSRNTAGTGASYDFTRWLTGKFDFSWSRIHRSIDDISEARVQALNANDTRVGPTFDIKPNSWLLLRAAYQYSWRSDPGYNPSGGSEMFFLTKRNQSKVSLYTDVSRWETFSVHAGFDFINDTYPEAVFRLESSRQYSPSVGFLYSPVEWLKFFADYNFDWIRWNQQYNSTISSRGNDTANTLTIGSDAEIIKNLLKFHIQYGFSHGLSAIDTNTSGVSNPLWPSNSNTWHELLARIEYQFHKNVALQVGYYFNQYHSKDFGVDIMNLWMGNFDNNTGQIRSVYLGNDFKGSYTAHVGMIGLKFKF